MNVEYRIQNKNYTVHNPGVATIQNNGNSK